MPIDALIHEAKERLPGLPAERRQKAEALLKEIEALVAELAEATRALGVDVKRAHADVRRAAELQERADDAGVAESSLSQNS